MDGDGYGDKGAESRVDAGLDCNGDDSFNYPEDGLDELAIGLPSLDDGSDEHGGAMVVPGQ